MDPFEDKPTSRAFSRVTRYVAFRAATLLLMLAIGIFLAIVVINYGGYIDKIHEADINEALQFVSLSMRGATTEEVAQAVEQMRAAMEQAYGLNSPFLIRCLRWFYQTITFDWGITYTFPLGLDSFSSSKPAAVSAVVLGRAPYTLLLAGATNIILFFASIFVALNLSRKYESVLDRLMIGLSPLSSIPNWVYGIILTVIFAGTLHLLPFGGMFDTFPPATKWGYIPIVAKHMILPVSAIFLSMFFSTVYTWRTFFLIHSGEDYLELAKAKGLPTGIIQRRYMLKPTLPYIITSFAMLMITFWQGIIVLEVFFNWPGLGQLFMKSVVTRSMTVTIGIVVVFALLLGISVFLLDIIYVLVDPRVKISTEGQTTGSFQRASLLDRIQATINLLSPLYIARQVSGFINRKLQNLRGYIYRTWSMRLRRSRQGEYPFRLSQSSGRIGKPPKEFCPYLRLANNQASAYGVASEQSRCYVYPYPQRVGRAFQAEICRTEAFHTCPRLLAVFAGPQAPVGNQAPAGNQAFLRPSPSTIKRPRIGRNRSVGQKASGLFASLREFKRYPAAIAGIMIILVLIGISIYTMITIPYSEAILRWGPESLGKNQLPKNAQPVWVNLFRKDPLPSTIIQNSADGSATDGMVTKAVTTSDKGVNDETITFTFDYNYTTFPQDLAITFKGQYEKKPFVIITWLTPDGREFDLGNISAVSGQRFLASQDLPPKYLVGQDVHTQNIMLSGTGGPPAVVLLFRHPNEVTDITPIKGTYTLKVEAFTFEQGSSLDAEMILYGQVYGLAGTDDLRRDLKVALLWGTPIALAFGFLGAISTGVISMMIAAVGVWFGGWVDTTIQRLTEINMILPTLPMAIMIYYLYSKSIWMILGVIILLSIFGSSIKTYRAAFLQVKEAPYMDAAKAYGASNWRLIRQYLVPRIIPLLIPQLVILVPSYVFFEATLAYLKVSDPILPTWGKVVYDALTKGAFAGYYYWVLEPVALMIITALAFAFVGFALDSILNPRLRRI